MTRSLVAFVLALSSSIAAARAPHTYTVNPSVSTGGWNASSIGSTTVTTGPCAFAGTVDLELTAIPGGGFTTGRLTGGGVTTVQDLVGTLIPLIHHLPP